VYQREGHSKFPKQRTFREVGREEERGGKRREGRKEVRGEEREEREVRR
jgi:hypothetical protein